MSKPEFVELAPQEEVRTYTFPGDELVTLDNVVRIAVSASGNHRLETADGVKHIVPAGWLHIAFLSDGDWTF